jgi:hypothetical protein
MYNFYDMHKPFEINQHVTPAFIVLQTFCIKRSLIRSYIICADRTCLPCNPLVEGEREGRLNKHTGDVP